MPPAGPRRVSRKGAKGSQRRRGQRPEPKTPNIAGAMLGVWPSVEGPRDEEARRLVGQGFLVRLGAALDRLELAAGLAVGQADLLGVPVHHPAGEVLELGPAIEVLQKTDLVALLLLLGPGEERLAGLG